MKIKVLFIAVVMAVMAVNIGYCIDNGLIEKAKISVRRSLKDPESARFRDVHVGKETNRPVRGEVNAKNSFGGYIGFNKFFVDLKRNKVFFESVKLKEIEDWNNAVREASKALGEEPKNIINPMENKEYRHYFFEGW